MEQLKKTPQVVAAGLVADELGAAHDIARPAAIPIEGITPPPPERPQPAAPTPAAGPPRRKRIPRAQVINRLNYLNFTNGRLHVNFRHPDYGEVSRLPATPQPCLDGRLDCRWAPGINTRIFQTHQFDSLLLNHGRQMISIVPRLLSVDQEGFSCELPEFAEEVSGREVQRHLCRQITAQLIQGGEVFSGSLVDFNACAFKIRLSIGPGQSFEAIAPRAPATVIFTSRERTLYSGVCRVLRATRGRRQRHYVLAPLRSEIQRYRKTRYRSRRLRLTPSPDLIFEHPLTGGRVNLKVIDLSGSGFSVEEDQNSALLLPGLILPRATLRFADKLQIDCSAQVVFRKPLDPHQRRNVRCGLTLLDIDPRDHVTIVGLLYQARDANAYICNQVDLDALWDFFFETGFIYPSKYALIEHNKEDIKATYQRLYSRSPDIARHFIYQDKGVILGHMAMVRFYEDAWLIHHHAARRNAMKRAGLVVLDQIGRFAYDAYRLFSMHMNYLICYYRPDNRFPSRIFGGLAAHIDDPGGCSLDPFAFIQQVPAGGPALPEGWRLAPSTVADLEELGWFYRRQSGGLALKALDLEPGVWKSSELSEEYRRHGFRRSKHHFSLHREGRQVAFFMVTLSDIGLNLSDLTNCVKVFVIDPAALPAAQLWQALARLRRQFDQPAMPVLIYPAAFAEQQAIAYDKQYVLWALRTHGQSDKYFEYLDRLLRLS